MNSIFDKEFFYTLNNISIRLNIKLSKGAQGGRKSKVRGTSVEFSDFREYVHGDDFRRVDWNTYGRFEKLFIKLFMEEREGNFSIFIDSSKSMDFGKFNKGDLALKIAAALSYLGINNLDRVRIGILKEEGAEILKASRGKESFLKIIKGLEDLEFSGRTNLKKSIIKSNFTSKGMTIIISDFLIPDGEKDIENIVKYLTYKKQKVVFIQILCEEEMNPEVVGTKNIIDVETKEEVKVSITPKIIKLYQEKIKEQEDMIRTITRKYGGIFIKINSEEDIEKIILKDFFNHKLLG
ncbi:MAG: DUF58 domain-containing protein [Clostridium sp.]